MIDINNFSINKKQKIVIVSCDNIFLLMLKNILEPKYTITNLNSCEECKGYIENNKIDLIIADVSKYKDKLSVNAVNLIKHISATYRNIPAIVISDKFTEPLEQKYLEQGAVDCILTSSYPTVMLERIKKTIQNNKYCNDLEKIINSQSEEINLLKNSTLASFADLIDRRDVTTGGHVKRTQIYVEYLTTRMSEIGHLPYQLSVYDRNAICSAAVLHDIGKITIPDNILCKKGKLTDEEFEKMRNHTTEGAKIIKQNLSSIFMDDKYVQIASDMAEFHHEKWNGEGYPNKLVGENIPLCARIMSIADVFDALTTKRQYKDAVDVNEAIEQMIAEKGISFDPELLPIFFKDKTELTNLHHMMVGLGY